MMKSPFRCKNLGSTLKFLEPPFSPLTFRMKPAIWNKVEGRKNEWEERSQGGKEREIGKQEIRERRKAEGEKEESASVAEAPWMGEPECE